MQKKAIVTGASGFIGSHVCAALARRGAKVYAVVRGESGMLAAHENVKIIRCELDRIGDLCELIPDRDIDVFYHLAWEGSAGPARSDESLQMQNALATAAALRTADRMKCRKFVNAGSIMEQEVLAVVYAQDSRPDTAYVYGAAKVAARTMCKPIASALSIDLCWAVITNAYGTGEVSPRFVNTTIRKILSKEPLRFTAATQNYDFVYIDDVAEAFVAIGDHGKPNREYVIGSGTAKQLREFILEMCQTLAPDAECVFGDIPFTGCSLPLKAYAIDALREDCGFAPKVSFSEGVTKTMEWLRQQQKGNG